MRILVSAGPTREAVDPVRFISNRSSGRMGYAIAQAGLEMGHEVELVSGPASIAPPKGLAALVKVESAAEMAEAMRRLAPKADLIFMAAAVADYRPVKSEASKIKKTEEKLTLELERTEDILASLGAAKRKGQTLVGFAAETDDMERNALDKMRRKNLDWIVANEVGRPDRGFESSSNAATLLAKDGRRFEFPLMDKAALAARLLSTILGQTP